jgi:SulP family sulfate permease
MLSIILFLREQVGGNVVRRKSFVGQRSSTWYRPEAEMRILEQKGDTAVIFELQGSLFFGTTHQLYLTLEPELATTDFLILDMQRVQSVDVTAAHMLNLVRDALSERGVPLLLSSVRERLPNGRNLREFLELAGLVSDGKTVLILPSLEAAIEWVEGRLLGEIERDGADLPPLELHEIDLFKGSKPDTLTDLESCMETRRCKAGETIYARGDAASNLYLVRSGEVLIKGYVRGSGAARLCHIATYGRGEFFGGLGFLDHRPRANDAIASRDAELYVLTLEKFNYLAEAHKRIAFVLVSQLARTLAVRLRHADDELTLLQEN